MPKEPPTQTPHSKSGDFEPLRIESPRDLSPLIDHTLLRDDASDEDIIRLCREARENGFATVCIRSQYLNLAARELAGSKVLPITVVGFPTGRESTDEKVNEVEVALERGAKEIDMVLSIEDLKLGDYESVLSDIRAVVRAASSVPVKVILETSELTDAQKIIGCALSQIAGAHFVKTSTGFSRSGANSHDVALMRQVVGSRLGVKASGGIKTFEDAKKMILAGATRLGTSSGVAITQGLTAPTVETLNTESY